MNMKQKAFRKDVKKGSLIKVTFGKRIKNPIYDVGCEVISIRNDKNGTRCWVVENKDLNILGIGVPDTHHTVFEHRLFVDDRDFTFNVQEEQKESEIKRLLQVA